MIPTTELDSIEFPGQIVSPGRLSTAVHVIHRREADAAWGQSVVFVLTQDD